MKVSLITATVGRCDELERLVCSLKAQSCQDFELILVDQNKDQRLEPIICRLASGAKFPMKHVRTGIKGLSRARNLGLKNSDYEVVGYPDDDCWYEEDLIERLLTRFGNNVDLDGVLGRWHELDSKPAGEHFLSRKNWRNYKVERSACSCSLFLKRSLVEQHDGFDERLGLCQWFGASEEIDLILRCLENNSKILFDPEIKFHHALRPRFKRQSGAASFYRRSARGTGAIYAKHSMSFGVVLRGFVSPILKLFLPPYIPGRFGPNVMTTLGRIEGYRGWKQRYPR